MPGIVFRQRTSKEQASGLALPIALITGSILLIASAGLAAKLLMQRRTGATESYKQIAELAASNGLNRILAALNATEDDDISYLWHLNQSENNPIFGAEKRQWELSEEQLRPAMEQPCYPLNMTESRRRELLAGSMMAPGESLRSDGREEKLGMEYRLRSYSFSPGDSKATFYIEGYTTQTDNSKTKVLARSLLTRVLALRSYVASNDHWGVIAAKNLRLGSSTISGPGTVLWMIDRDSTDQFGVSGGCSASALGMATGSTDARTQVRLWPIVNTDFPSPGIFDSISQADQIGTGINKKRRIWNIDDSRTTKCSGLNAGTGSSGETICTRGETDTTWSSGDSASTVTRINGVVTAISIHAEQICEGAASEPCLIWIEKIQLGSGAKLSIETSDSTGARPVILRMLRPQESIRVSNGILCQADYYPSQTAPLPCSNSPVAERLAIVGSNGDDANTCNESTQIVAFTGESLPAALILMPQGSVVANGPTDMHGMIWAKNICASSGINLKTNNPAGSSIHDGLRNTWKWDSSLTFGRTATRGIRGTGLDLFRRW
ncbi:MAG: hypothetical protein RLZZ216_11 [Cyanobacteriota bacterium]|jgi:hypothetical protein